MGNGAYQCKGGGSSRRNGSGKILPAESVSATKSRNGALGAGGILLTLGKVALFKTAALVAGLFSLLAVAGLMEGLQGHPGVIVGVFAVVAVACVLTHHK
jgi:hypothetical protein